MKERLEVIEDTKHGLYRIAWYFPEEGEYGYVLGESRTPVKEPSNNQDGVWDVWKADITAKTTPEVERDDDGFNWESLISARNALRIIKAALKEKKEKKQFSLKDWEKKALAAGWTPPVEKVV